MTILIYYVLLEALNAVRQQAQLEERAAQQDTLLAMQYTQYQQLSRHIEEVREARHDLCQHLNLIEHYLQSGKTEDLNTYIEQYRMTLPPDTARTWCENYAVNFDYQLLRRGGAQGVSRFFGPHPASALSPAG